MPSQVHDQCIAHLAHTPSDSLLKWCASEYNVGTTLLGYTCTDECTHIHKLGPAATGCAARYIWPSCFCFLGDVRLDAYMKRAPSCMSLANPVTRVSLSRVWQLLIMLR